MAQSQFEAAAANVKSAPQSMSAWDEVEELARAAERPDDMIALYRDVLQKGLDPQLVEVIGERAAAFCDEWFGDEPKVAESILGRVLDLAPQSEQALQRLSVLYTQSERWNDLLRLYDRALIAVKDPARRIKLLREAAQLAKDVANQPEKAIGYQQRLLPLTPDDVQLQTSLERLLERHERWAELIGLWEGRLDRLGKAEREKGRARIATVQLDNLRDSARALATVRVMLAGADDDREATALLERILEAPHTQKKERDGALDMLRTHYDATGRPREVIRVLERVIAIDPASSRALREEAGARLSELDDDGAAMDHYAALLALTPDSSVTQEKLRQLAQRSGNYARYADGVASAAQHAETAARKVELLAEAARTRLDLLDDAGGAIELYQQALALEGAGAKEQLQVGRRLSELYSRVDRPRERFEILTRLAELEPSSATRKQVIGDAARLAEGLGEHDRALALWQQRIDADAADHAALDAIVALLERVERWPALIDALERRAGAATSPAQQRADLTRVAVVAREKLHDGERAIAAWQRVTSIFGDDGETVEALSQLLGEAGRWKELADLLERTSGKDVERTTARLNRLGLALAHHLHEPARALAAYRAALAIDPTNATAREGLESLLAESGQRAAAADALAASYRERADWAGLLRLVPARLADAADDRARLAILREAAHVAGSQVGEPAAALGHLAQALPLAPRDGLMLAQLLDLADRTGGHAVADRALGAAIAALGGDLQEAARLRVQRAGLLERHLGDEASALSELFAVLQVDPGNPAAVAGVARLAPRHGQWPMAATAVLAHAAAKERLDEKLLESLEHAAVEAGPEALEALATGVDRAASALALPPAVAAQVWTRLAGWHRDHRQDAAAAIAAYERALAAGGDRAEPLRAVVALARPAGASARLLELLRRLADVDPRDLDVLVEASAVARELGDREAAATIGGQVLGRATAAWRGSAPIRSTRPADEVALSAIEGLVELHRGAARPRAAVDLLVESARLPFAGAQRRALRLRAAEIAAAELGDRAAAIDVYRGALADDPGDVEVIDRLGTLLEEDGRTAELLGLRQLQLRVESDQARRLALRLDVARLVGLVEEKGGRLEALEANLADAPGHDPSIDALSALYAGRGQHKALAELLEGQAAKLEAAGDVTRAARLWARAASTAEHETREVERAIADYKRVVNLAPSADAYRALARLQLGRGQPAQAVPWFESLLATMTGRERLGVVHQLARAHLAAGHPDRAISAIEANLDDKEPATDLRLLLAELYREGQHWEPLARHLTRSLGMFVEDGRSGALAREAASIYTEKLDQPAKAIPALERALALDPTDRKLRAHLAAGLRTAGQLAEARAQLHELIEGFGRRRSPERAVLHVELAKVARAEGKLDEALAEMDAASKMDLANARIQRELAELAREAGQLEMSERTYRSLLLTVRRQPPGDDEQAVGQSEVLYELSALARARGEVDQAKELLESAIDAAIQSDVEVRRLRRSLLAHGEADTLLRVLQLRLARSSEGGSQARLLADMAAALDGPLGRPAEALDAMLKAVQAAPDRLELHDRARELAKKTGDTAKYVETVELVVDRLRRKDDPPLVAALLLRAGEALEQDAGDRAAASAMYRRVEALGVRLADAYSAQARVAGALGDTDQQARALDNMLKLAGEGEGGPAQVDALYRLAEIFVNTAARRTQGVELVERALAAEPRWMQAGRVLRAAATAEPGNARVMQLYDRVARNSGDAELRLDFLERRSQLAGVTPAQVREAVELALDTGEEARAEVLLARAIEQARGSSEGPAAAVWAMLALAERRIATGDLLAARDLVYDAIGSAEPRQIEPLIAKLASKAAASPDHHGLAADMYELLRERAPGDRTIWEPLLALYRTMGDGDRVASLVSMTLPHIADAGLRGALRRDHAVYLASLGRAYEAADVLRDALTDDPDDVLAGALLEDNLRALDDVEGLRELLAGRFADALRRRNPATTIDLAHRLAALVESQGESPAPVYRAALEVAPDDRELLRRVVAGLTTDDDPAAAAALMERLLAVESPEHAPALASHLASAYEQAGDWDGVQRTLELAHRAAPGDDAIHGRLEQFYRDRGLWRALAELMIADAARSEDGAIAVMRLRDAADVFATQLGSPGEAARALALARDRRPDSPTLVGELASALVRAGDEAGAIAAIGAAIDGPNPPIADRGRLELLMQRAALRASIEDDDGAVADLDAAYQLDPGRSSPPLADALERMRNRALAAGDLERERLATLRLSTLLTELGDPERARDLLVTWIERAPHDPDPLYLLRDMDAAIEHWDGVIAACTRLAYIVEGDPQVQAALDIARAAEQAGRPGEAVPILEMVFQAQPGAAALRDKLRELYAQAGAHRELAAILVADAEHADDVPTRFDRYKRAAELLLYSAGDPAAAAGPAGQAAALAPDDHGAAMLYVDILIASGQTEEAAQVLDAAIAAQKRRSPELATMQQRMGRVQGMLGDREGHLSWLKKAFDVDRKSGEIAAELAQLATEIGDYELALKPLRAISLMENPQPVTRPMALLWEARIEHTRGNRAKAELWAKKALREDPSYAEAQQFLDELGA